MKTNFKKLLVILSIMLGLGSLPLQASAFGFTNIHTVAANFCTDLPSLQARFQNSLNSANDKINLNQLSRSSDIDKAEQATAEKLSQKRKEWDTLRSAHYDKLSTKAVSDEQKQAVATFKDTIENAVSLRRQKVDTAVDEFRAGLTNIVSGEQGSVSSIFKTYMTAVNSALQTAQTSCNNGSDPAQARLQLQQDIRAARTNLLSSQIGLSKIRTDIEALRVTRQTAIDAAVTEFNQTANNAQLTLRTVLGQ